MASGLYGICHSNRSDEGHWSKNCFNSSFPASLACYMMDHDIPALYVQLVKKNGRLCVETKKIPMRKVFNCGTAPASQLTFDFESVYSPYKRYSFDEIDRMDLVVKQAEKYLSALEVKLTVLPTSQTSTRPESEWGCEMVIRSATTSYCALGMFDAARSKAGEIREIFETECSSIRAWDNDFEMRHKTPVLSRCVDEFEQRFLSKQKPLVMQTIWKTQGMSHLLAENAFDVVVWSDYAFSRLFVDDSRVIEDEMSRPMRATARLARCLWELSKSEKIHVPEIYRQMAFGNQTDKEFAIAGKKWKNYVDSERILRPILPKAVLRNIITDGYIEKLSPERRFDQTLYFTMRSQLGGN